MPYILVLLGDVNSAWRRFYILSYCHFLTHIGQIVLQILTETERQSVESILMIKLTLTCKLWVASSDEGPEEKLECPLVGVEMFGPENSGEHFLYHKTDYVMMGLT